MILIQKVIAYFNKIKEKNQEKGGIKINQSTKESN